MFRPAYRGRHRLVSRRTRRRVLGTSLLGLIFGGL